MTDYDIFYAKNSGKGYAHIDPDKTHYDDAIDTSAGHGNSRKWGDASFETQKQVIDAITEIASRHGLSLRETAHVLAIAYQESGFNPDAAAGTTTASGLGQFIDRTGEKYGLNDTNRFDIQANAKALIEHYIDNKNLAEKRGQGEEFIYKYHHDGPSRDYGGLALSQNKVMPLINKFEAALNGGDVSHGIEQNKSNFDNSVGDVQKKFNDSTKTSSPIILDLDGNGVETTAVQDGAYFDHGGDGFAELTGWASADDGLLVRDIDGNGCIDSGAELFGNETRLLNGNRAANGFEALADIDDNQDGRIDTEDVTFADLKIWIDANGDGYSQSEELWTPQEIGIASIATTYTNSNFVDGHSNAHRQIGSYTGTDGNVFAAEDVWFTVDRTNSFATTWVDVPIDVAALPDLSGYGKVHNLRQAMVLDNSGMLKSLVSAYQAETDEGQRHTLVNSILYHWANADTIDPQSRGSYVDARQLVTLEHFLGDAFYQADWGVNPGDTAGKKITAAFQDLSTATFAQLEAQSRFSDLYAQIHWQWHETTQTLQADFTDVISTFQNYLNSDSAQGLALLDGFIRNLKVLDLADGSTWQSFTQGFTNNINALNTLQRAQLVTLAGSAENERLNGTASNERLLGFGGDDSLTAQGGDDILEGGGGQDILEGGAGIDTLIGGVGNDVLDGNAGSDFYLFQIGFGQDHIHQYDSTTNSIDTVLFTDLTSQNITQTVRQGDDLILSLNTGDTLTVDGYFDSAARRVDIFNFANGEYWDLTTIKQQTNTLGTTANDVLYGYTVIGNRIFGLEGDDTLTGNTGNDYLNGDVGDDLLYGQSGDDTLDGGSGNDTLKGGTGNDSYFVESSGDVVSENSAAGNDTVYSSVTYTLQANIENLTLINSAGNINATGNALNNVLLGNEYNNYLNGNAGADTLNGNGGVDTLTGGSGNDTFCLSYAISTITDFQSNADKVVMNNVLLKNRQSR